MSINIAIIGHGYVGKAVDHGFSTRQVTKYIVDPIYGTTIEELQNKVRLHAAFVAVPTPFGDNGEIDASIVRDVVSKLAFFECPIVIKSTTTPDVVEELYLANGDRKSTRLNSSHGYISYAVFCLKKKKKKNNKNNNKKKKMQ